MLEGVVGVIVLIALVGGNAILDYCRATESHSAGAAEAVGALLHDPEADLALTLLEDSSGGSPKADEVIRRSLTGPLLGASSNEGSVQLSFESALRHLAAVERSIRRSKVSLGDVAPPLERHLQALWKHRELIETFAERTAIHDVPRLLRRIARLESLWAAGKSLS